MQRFAAGLGNGQKWRNNHTRLGADAAIVRFPSMNNQGYFTYLPVSKIAYRFQPPSSAGQPLGERL
jgi:hypothetical protein